MTMTLYHGSIYLSDGSCIWTGIKVYTLVSEFCLILPIDYFKILVIFTNNFLEYLFKFKLELSCSKVH